VAEQPAANLHRRGQFDECASTDMGNVSQVIPAIHPYIGIDSPPAVNHARVRRSGRVPGSGRSEMQGALALAGSDGRRHRRFGPM
jgi:hypothetical protein